MPEALKTVSACLLFALAASGTAAQPDPKDPPTDPTTQPVQIAAKVDAEFTPQPGLKYEIAVPSLFKADAPGPAEKEPNVAWSLANEFIHRTSLAGKYALPASSVSPDGDGFKVTFKPLGSEPGITVEVDTKARTVVLEPTSPTVEQPGSATGGTPKTGGPNADVSEAEARQLATEHVNSRFKGHVWKTDLGDRTFSFLTPQCWHSIGKKDGRLVLRCGGVRGQEFQVSMNPDGTEIRVDGHGYALR